MSREVRYLGLSNVTADQVRRAHAVAPVVAIQYEYSLWRREVESELLPTLRALGIGLVPWSPLGSGFLTGQVDQLAENDFRRNNPRYSGGKLDANRDRFAPLIELARAGCDACAVGPGPAFASGSRHRSNSGDAASGAHRRKRTAATIVLDSALLEEIDKLARRGLASGATLL